MMQRGAIVHDGAPMATVTPETLVNLHGAWSGAILWKAILNPRGRLVGKLSGCFHCRNSNHAGTAAEDCKIAAFLHSPPHFVWILDYQTGK